MAFDADCGVSTVLVCSACRAQSGSSFREKGVRPTVCELPEDPGGRHVLRAAPINVDIV